jgi:hypothetical protein
MNHFFDQHVMMSINSSFSCSRKFRELIVFQNPVLYVKKLLWITYFVWFCNDTKCFVFLLFSSDLRPVTCTPKMLLIRFRKHSLQNKWSYYLAYVSLIFKLNNLELIFIRKRLKNTFYRTLIFIFPKSVDLRELWNNTFLNNYLWVVWKLSS